jgi:hypothetical protein
MLPKFRSFVRPIVHSSYSSFIVRSLSLFIIHRSFIRSIHHQYSLLLFDVTIHRYYSPSLLFTDTIHHRYYSSTLLFIDDIYNNFFVVTIYRYYSSIVRSPQLSTTHPSCCPVHIRPAIPIFQSYELRWLWFSLQWELPIWPPIPGFSKLSTLNFIPSNQASKLRFQ